MSDELDRGITVTEIAAMDQPIEVATETTAAFVGRALRGPLDTPVLVTSYTAFCRRFGGTWQRSSLGPAVQHFFKHGGSNTCDLFPCFCSTCKGNGLYFSLFTYRISHFTAQTMYNI